MKNVLKKIAAAAMAFTLIGAGSAITNTVAPEASNTITASAANHAHGQFYYDRLASTKLLSTQRIRDAKARKITTIKTYAKIYNRYCGQCDKVFYTYSITDTVRTVSYY